jgi:pseudouridine-5'-phosphate glycosidase
LGKDGKDLLANLPSFVSVAPEVAEALHEHRPVVALESTIIAHGMPFPENLQMALEVERIVRSQGAVPVTMAIAGGKVVICARKALLEQLADSLNNPVMKVGTRSIAECLQMKALGATTVSGTVYCAALVGIPFMATGGLGGVHRGYHANLDISADLTEMARQKVAVVSSGVKSVLDIANTLEVLETLSVPVIGHRASEFPAFYSRESGIKLDLNYETVDEIAEFLHFHWQLPRTYGVCIANPIPADYALNAEEMERTMRMALEECEKLQIRGKKVTPFLLSRIKELTGGKSLAANQKLVQDNAHVAAKLAVAYFRSFQGQ